MHVKTTMAHEPSKDRRIVMRGVIVGDEMNLFTGRCLSVDEIEESNPFFMKLTRFRGRVLI